MRGRAFRFFLLSGLLVFGAIRCTQWFVPSNVMRLERTAFADIAGWGQSDPRSALAAFARSCAIESALADSETMSGVYGGQAGEWRAACAGSDAPAADAASARAFFQTRFVPYRIFSGGQPEGLFTGYYEPLLHGSRKKHGRFTTPLYGVPGDLVTADLGLFREALKGQHVTGRVQGGVLVPYATRAQIARDGLAGKPLFYVDDPVDAFFLQIQGSGRIALDDGTTVRAAFAGQNGQPYTAIGRVLVGRGALSSDNVSMQSIRAWLEAHPQEMQAVMDADASYVFFAEKPVGDPSLGAEGAEGAALTAGVSLAADRSIHALGAPVWVEAQGDDTSAAFARLMVMQDTGGAIRGAIRGDIYWGFGREAEVIAGTTKMTGRMILFLPREIAERLGAHPQFSVPSP